MTTNNIAQSDWYTVAKQRQNPAITLVKTTEYISYNCDTATGEPEEVEVEKLSVETLQDAIDLIDQERSIANITVGENHLDIYFTECVGVYRTHSKHMRLAGLTSDQLSVVAYGLRQDVERLLACVSVIDCDVDGFVAKQSDFNPEFDGLTPWTTPDGLTLIRPTDPIADDSYKGSTLTVFYACHGFEGTAFGAARTYDDFSDGLDAVLGLMADRNLGDAGLVIDDLSDYTDAEGNIDAFWCDAIDAYIDTEWLQVSNVDLDSLLRQ